LTSHSAMPWEQPSTASGADIDRAELDTAEMAKVANVTQQLSDLSRCFTRRIHGLRTRRRRNARPPGQDYPGQGTRA
jgi:hypothetical protein